MEIVYLIIFVFIFAAVLYFIAFNRKPKTFICRGCGKEFHHTSRTLKAKAFSASFYCKKCHQKWLESRKNKEGCLPFVAIVLFLLIFILNLTIF